MNKKSLAEKKPRGVEAGILGAEAGNKSPKTTNVSGAYIQPDPRGPDIDSPSSIQTVTVGSGIAPDPVPQFARHSWALPPIGSFTLPRRFYSVVKIIQQN